MDFGVSSTRQLVEIPILNDEETEDTEQFFAQLTLVHSDADVQLVPDRATIEIVDNDGMITNSYIHLYLSNVNLYYIFYVIFLALLLYFILM